MPAARSDDGHASHLESRLAKTETQIEALTTDVRSLVSIVKQQGDEFQSQMRQLAVAVTTASGPRKTEWSTIIAGTGLIIGIGTSAMSPLYMRMSDMQKAVEHQARDFRDHERLPMHKASELEMDHIRKLVDGNSATVEMKLATLEKGLDKRFADMTKTVDDVKYQGSPITRERLAVIESRLKDLDGKPQ